MRQKIVAGNWKMNKTYPEAVALVEEVVSVLSNKATQVCSIILAPPFPYLQKIVSLCEGLNKVFVAGQNCSHELSGAYTGEVSASMLQSVGVTHVIVGHSERRMYFNEDNSLILKKIQAAFLSKLIPIYCCGESLEERESKRHKKVINKQLTEVIFQLPKEVINNLIIAYEPVWAIGTGKTATSEQAQEMHYYIRSLIKEQCGEKIANTISILYGGSCNPQNAAGLFSNEDIDGGLIGSASLKAADFISIINSIPES